MRKITKYGLSLLFASSLLSACTDDDPVSTGRYDDGYLHFKFAFDSKDGAWNDDGAPQQKTRFTPPSNSRCLTA